MRNKKLAVAPEFANLIKSKAAARGLSIMEYSRMISKLDDPLNTVITPPRRNRNEKSIFEI